ncbi:enoyl-CoA hydratase [Peribacillus sp. Hz7]|uniref:enoyl-CoA hydratase n=1 Tax=Peribacillus sp. Hz7 TaxID=3344873 RepID=UPI0035CB087B
MSKLVRVEKREGIATIILDNPPLNILSHQVVKELDEIFHMVAKDPEVICVILTGSGNKAFMAGANIKEFPDKIGKNDVKEFSMHMHRVFNLIDFLPQPTIAVINGWALGGGCELALTCDIRIAEAHAQIGLPEIKLGLFPGAGGTQRLPRLVGEAKAKEMMFTGEPISMDEALRIGLVNQVVPSGEGMTVAYKVAQKIAGYSLQALSRIKRAVDEGMDQDFDAALEREAHLFGEVFQTEDVKEGVQAFIEKRTPQFTHK